MMIAAPAGTAGLTIAAVQALLTAANYGSQIAAPTEYGKFVPGSPAKAAPSDRQPGKVAAPASGPMVSSRAGMVGIYAPALVVSAVRLQAVAGTALDLNGREVVIAGMLSVHFLKRCLECLFLHKYSGQMPAATSGFIGLFYALMSQLIIFQQGLLPAAQYEGSEAAATWAVGLTMFVVGQLGNLAHHTILARMRSASTTTKYFVPQGGLFQFTTCPHYFFEVIAWLGIAVTASQVNAYLVALGMLSYLAGRADSQREWYRSKFEEFPASRTRLIPFLF